MRMSLAFRAVSCTLAVIANYSGQNVGLEIWRNCNVTWIAFVFQILHFNFGHSRWTDTIRCSNIGDLRSRIPTPGFICLYIIMSLQAKMAAESIQDADLSFLSNYVHHSNRRGLSSFNGLQARKVDPTVGTIVHTNTTSFMAPKLLQHNLLAAVSSPYLTELTGIFTIASFLHPGEILCSVCGIWYILCPAIWLSVADDILYLQFNRHLLGYVYYNFFVSLLSLNSF